MHKGNHLCAADHVQSQNMGFLATDTPSSFAHLTKDQTYMLRIFRFFRRFAVSKALQNSALRRFADPSTGQRAPIYGIKGARIRGQGTQGTGCEVPIRRKSLIGAFRLCFRHPMGKVILTFVPKVPFYGIDCQRKVPTYRRARFP